MISDELRCIFVHIPKTGGSSIEKVIWPDIRKTDTQHLWGYTTPTGNRYQSGGLQHLLARQIRREVGDAKFDSYFRFSFVRNPWDRSVSQFEYTRTRRDLLALLGLTGACSFAQYLSRIRDVEHVQWYPQRPFIVSETGECLVQFVGRFERLEKDSEIIFSRLGVNFTGLPHIHKSARGPYRDYYCSETRNAVAMLYEQDIDTFKYTF